MESKNRKKLLKKIVYLDIFMWIYAVQSTGWCLISSPVSDAMVRFWTTVWTWTCLNRTQVQVKVWRNGWTGPKVQFSVHDIKDRAEPLQTQFGLNLFGSQLYLTTKHPLGCWYFIVDLPRLLGLFPTTINKAPTWNTNTTEGEASSRRVRVSM